MLNKYPNYQIVNLDKLTYAGNLENLKSVEKNKNYSFIQGDICDKKIVRKAVEGCDIVVHFAAESHVDRSIDEPAIFIQTNIVGTLVLLETSRELDIKRFHHISTDEVFGTLSLEDKSEKFNENTPYAPRSPYAASKAGSDHLVRAFIETYNFPATISNCTNNYGPFQFPEKIIPLFIQKAIEGKPLPIYGKGKAVRDYLYVVDHCRAIDLIIHKGRIGETYCISGDTQKDGVAIADSVLDSMEKSKDLKTFVDDRKGHDMRYAMDHSKITQELGWKPSVTFEEGLKKTIKWYKSNKSWWQNIISKEFKKND